MWVTVLWVICVLSCFRCCTVDQHSSGAALQEDWRPMRSTVLLWPCATDRAAWAVHLRQVELCPPVSTVSNIYIQCTVRAAIYVMFWGLRSKSLRLLSITFRSSTDWFKMIYQQCYFKPDTRTNPVLLFKNSQLIMDYTHSMHVRALNIQLRVQASIHVVVERRKTWIDVNSYVNINEVPLMESVCHCS